MRASEDFILREIAGEFMLVPTGAAAAKFNGLITTNEIGCFIFKALRDEEQTEESLVTKITGEYTIDADTAAEDLREFLQQMRDVGALVEEK